MSKNDHFWSKSAIFGRLRKNGSKARVRIFHGFRLSKNKKFDDFAFFSGLGTKPQKFDFVWTQNHKNLMILHFFWSGLVWTLDTKPQKFDFVWTQNHKNLIAFFLVWAQNHKNLMTLHFFLGIVWTQNHNYKKGHIL